MAMNSSFTALPDDVLQRVLVGVARDDHDATAAACRVFRDVIRGPRFLRLRREYGFAERGIILVGRDDENDEAPLEIYVAGNPGAMAVIPEDLSSINPGGSTTDGGGRLFVSTTRTHGLPYEIFAVDASARRWSPFATLPLNQRLHCTEWHGGLLYVAGGKPEDFGASLNTLHAFDETTGLWDDLPPMPHACARAASGVIGNELFIAGGRGVGDQPLSTLQIYDFTTRTWRLGAQLPNAQHGAYGIVVGDGKLYLVSSRLSEVQCMLMYDVQSNTWTEQSLPPQESGGPMHAFVDNDLIVSVHRHNLTFYHGTWNSGLGLGTPGIAHAVGGSVLVG